MKSNNTLFLIPLFILSFSLSCSTAKTSKEADSPVQTPLSKPATMGEVPAVTISKGSVEIIEGTGVRYHVIDALSFTVTMVETPTDLIVVDTGIKLEILPKFGKEIAQYAKAINKPTSVIITHNHSDHWGNIDHFPSARVFAEAKVAQTLFTDKTFVALFKERKVQSIEDSRTIGGLTFKVGTISNAETVDNPYFYIEEQKVIFAEDLVYNQNHLYIREYTPLEGEDELENWIAGLKVLKSSFGGYRVFVGHGGTRRDFSKTIDENIAYLSDAHALIKGTKKVSSGEIATNNKSVVEELKALYPSFGEGALELSLPGAFYKDDPGSIWFSK